MGSPSRTELMHRWFCSSLSTIRASIRANEPDVPPRAPLPPPIRRVASKFAIRSLSAAFSCWYPAFSRASSDSRPEPAAEGGWSGSCTGRECTDVGPVGSAAGGGPVSARRSVELGDRRGELWGLRLGELRGLSLSDGPPVASVGAAVAVGAGASAVGVGRVGAPRRWGALGRAAGRVTVGRDADAEGGCGAPGAVGALAVEGVAGAGTDGAAGTEAVLCPGRGPRRPPTLRRGPWPGTERPAGRDRAPRTARLPAPGGPEGPGGGGGGGMSSSSSPLDWPGKP